MRVVHPHHLGGIVAPGGCGALGTAFASHLESHISGVIQEVRHEGIIIGEI